MSRLLIGILLLLTTKSIGQNIADSLILSIQTHLDSLAFENKTCKISYLNDKNTLYVGILDEEKIITEYGLLIHDIHPMGIFSISKDSISFIRLLSLENGNVFTKETTRNDINLSSSTNYVDFGGWPKYLNSKYIQIIVDELETLVLACTQNESTTNSTGEIYSPPPKHK